MRDCPRGGRDRDRGRGPARARQRRRRAGAAVRAARDGRRQHPTPGRVLDGRVELPRGPAGRGVPAGHRRRARRARGHPVAGRPADRARRRHLGRRQRGRHRGGARLLAAREPDPRHRPVRADRPHRARRRDGEPAEGRRTARAAVRSRPVHAGARDARRDDRQQRVRPARGRLRADRRQRARARRGRRHRADGSRHAPARARSTSSRVSTRSSARTSTSCGPSWAASAGRSPATRSSTCCPRRAPTWPRRWSAPRGPSARCSARPSGWSRSRRPRCSSSSATPTCRRPPTPSPRCSRTPRWRSRAWTPGWSTWSAASAVPPPSRRCPPAAGGSWSRSGGADLDEALERAHALAADAGTDAVGLFPPGPEAAAMWRIREDGAGLGGRTPSGEQAWPGFEDSAVPPERLGAYLRELEALMASHGVDGLAYGHFGDGCVHLRLDIPLERSGNPLRAFMTDAATLVASHGGSLSGEHGDGRARSELLPVMYSPKAIDLFGAFKDLLDPRDLLNPGVLVRPRPLDADLRRPWARPLLADGHGFSFAHDAGDLTTAAAPLRRRRQVPGGQHRDRRVHVPVVPGDEGREGLDPRPRARAAGDGERHARLRRLVVARGARLARPVPVLQGVLVGLPRGRRHGSVQVRGAAPYIPREAAADVALRARLAAPLGPADHRRPRSGRAHERGARHPPGRQGGARRRRHGHAPPDGHVRAAPFRAWVRGEGRDERHADARARGSDRRHEPATIAGTTSSSDVRQGDRRAQAAGRALDRLVLRHPLAVRRAGGRRGAASTPATRCSCPQDDACCGLTWISTGQLDGATQAADPPARRARPVRGQRHPDRRARAVVHRGPALRPARPAARRPPRGRRRPRDPHARRAAHRARARSAPATAGRCRTCPTSPRSCSRTATTTR